MDDKALASVCTQPKTTHIQSMNLLSTQATAVKITDGQTMCSEMKGRWRKQTPEGMATLTKVCIIEKGKVMLSITRTKEETEQQPILKILDSRILYTQLPLQVSNNHFRFHDWQK